MSGESTRLLSIQWAVYMACGGDCIELSISLLAVRYELWNGRRSDEALYKISKIWQRLRKRTKTMKRHSGRKTCEEKSRSVR